MKKTILLAIVCTQIFFVFQGVNLIDNCRAEDSIVYVDDDAASGGDGSSELPYQNIQDAIDDPDSTEGKVYVFSGTYSENIEINKNLTLEGAGYESTIINGLQEDNHVITISSGIVNITGFTIQNAIGQEYDSIMMNKVSNCRIENNKIQNSDDGIYLFDSDYNTIYNNIFQNNLANAIYFSFSDNNVIENNQITNNENGINIGSYSDSNQIINNQITGKIGIPKGIGITIGSQTNNNLVYKNKLNDFAQNAKDLGDNNKWYKQETRQGNYWDDYTGTDSGDGRGTIPYNIPEGSQDIYPLGYFVSAKPTAYIDLISPNPAIYGQTVQFSGHGTDDGSVVGWEWYLNDNLVDTSEDFSYPGLNIGTYTVTFRVQDNKGEWSDFDSATLQINPEDEPDNKKPTATIQTITPNIAYYGEEIYFQGYGTDNDGTITGYQWSSNLDGILETSSSFFKSDLSIGTHKIELKVRDNDNDWSLSDKKTIIIQKNSSIPNIPPVADAGGPYFGYVNETITLIGSDSYDNDQSDSITYSWSFGDSETGSGVAVDHIYTQTGNYTVELTVRDSQGEQDKNTTYVKIENTPEQNNSKENEKKDKWVIPNYPLVFLIITIILFVIIGKKKWKK